MTVRVYIKNTENEDSQENIVVYVEQQSSIGLWEPTGTPVIVKPGSDYAEYVYNGRRIVIE